VNFEDVVLVVRVEVHVDVAVGSGLSAHQGLDTPTSFEPEPAACRSHGVGDLQNLGHAHPLLVVHDVILSSAGEDEVGEVRFER